MRRALLVGVDEYGEDSLTGCVTDALLLSQALSKHYDEAPNFDCKVLVAKSGASDIITKSSLREHLQQLFKYPAEVALFHFSGHGTSNSRDVYLCTQDGTINDEGVPLTEVLTLANSSKAKEVVILLDCCFSGQAGSPPVLDADKSILRQGVCILTGSRNDQPSVESKGTGVFTSLVLDALHGGAANVLGGVSAPAIYTFVEAALGAWDQRPSFKANISTAVDLRRCAPPVARGVLRRIPTLFPLPAEDFALDPTYEKTTNSACAANVAIFEELLQLTRVHLVVPVGAQHMYDAAMQSKACRLTPAGLYYWRLASNGRI